MTDTDFTREFHTQNQERLRELEKKEEEHHTLLTRIDANTACIPDIVKRVQSLESDRDKKNGALAVLGLLWGALEYFAHWFHKS